MVKRTDRRKSLVSVQIFVEGGGDQRITLTKCRRGFSEYCAKIVPPNHFRIIARGSRDEAFRKFKIAVENGRPGEVFALLVDSEEPVAAVSPVQHLQSRDRWDFSWVKNRQVFLMNQVMEGWLLADRERLAEFYDGGFVPNALPGSANSIEIIRKQDIEAGLKNATRNTRTKGEYHKTRHGFDLLASIDPIKVERASPQHAANFHKFLREQIR
jgi:hypothetical protein